MVRKPAVEGETAPDREHDRTSTLVHYDVEALLDDGEWQWVGYNFEDRAMAEGNAQIWRGVHAPVPVHRRLVKRTTTYWVWGDHDYVESEEEREVIAEYFYTGPADPWA
jgi:hypothetical protein